VQASETAVNMPPNPTIPTDNVAATDPATTVPTEGSAATGPPVPPAARKRRSSNGRLYTPKPRGRDVAVLRRPQPMRRSGCEHPGCYRAATWAMGLLIPIPPKPAEAPAEPVAASEAAPAVPTLDLSVEAAAAVPTPIPAVPTGILGLACEAHRESLIDRDNVAAHPKWEEIAAECRAGFAHDPDPKTATVRLVKIG